MKIVVIGGGPAGMMCAISSASNSNEVILIEKNEKLGKKLYITGKGRCNITNLCEKDEFLKHVIHGDKFLLSSISKFSPSDTLFFLNNAGLKTKVERGRRVFPVSDKSSDVIKTFEQSLKKNNVKILFNTKVEKITNNLGKFEIISNNDKIVCDAVVVATGGMSYSSTGSSGDGYIFAKDFGHDIVPLKPALVPIKLFSYDGTIAGLTLKNVKVTINAGGKTFSQIGEMLFTHTGVSGPTILTLSSLINNFDINHAILTVDLKMALDEETITTRIINDVKTYGKKEVKNYLPTLMPKSLINIFCQKADIKSEKRLCCLDREERKRIVATLKNLSFTIHSLDDLEYSIVTSGGVKLDEINPKNMESKKLKNLFFIGEVLDIDSLTGGYNIQTALSTGFACGNYLKEQA